MPRTPARVISHRDLESVRGALMDAQVLHERAVKIAERDPRNLTLGRACQRMREAQLLLSKAQPAREKAA